MRKGVRREYADSFRVFRAVVSNPDLRRVQTAFAGFTIAEWATWVALGVYAYDDGGASRVGLAGLAMMLPAAVAAPFVASLADRFRRERVLVLSYVAQGLAAAATAAAMLAALPSLVVYATAILGAVSQTAVRPVQTAMLPRLSRTPGELTAAHVGVITTRNLSLLLGPVAASLILGVGSPGSVYAVMSALLLGSAWAAGRIPVRSEAPSGKHREPERRALAGFSAIRREPRAAAVVALLTSKFFVQGLLRVVLVVAAIELLGLGDPGVGWLNAALGVGGALGAGATVVLIGRRRLSPALFLGAALWGLPLISAALWPAPVVAMVFLGCTGIGRSMLDVSGRTLLARIAPVESIAGVFGALESLYMASLAAGSAVGAVLVAWTGSRVALGLSGGLLPGVALLLWSTLTKSDDGPRADPRRLEIVERVPMFAPLEPSAIERLAAGLEEFVVDSGTAVIRQGEEGDRFYIVDRGHAEASIEGEVVATYGEGDTFGEIALLRDVPRTATVRAVTDLRLFSIGRAEFLSTVTGDPVSAREADRVVQRRLAENAERPAR